MHGRILWLTKTVDQGILLSIIVGRLRPTDSLQVATWSFLHYHRRTYMRVSFFVDGFNLYHSLRRASETLGLAGKGTRWLNLRALCESYLHIVGHRAGTENVYYFSAFATHRIPRDPDVVNRHRKYIQCLEDTGVQSHIGKFKVKNSSCYSCGRRLVHHEEKETDVAIGVHILEVLFRDECDTAVIITGDTDIAPAIRAAKRLFPAKRIIVGFPFERYNNELKVLADASFKITAQAYCNYQFLDPYKLSNGYAMPKPRQW